MKRLLITVVLLGMCASCGFAYSNRHSELEALARLYGYAGGRLTASEQGTLEVRSDAALAMQGDADFREVLKKAHYELLDSIDDKINTGCAGMIGPSRFRKAPFPPGRRTIPRIGRASATSGRPAPSGPPPGSAT